MGVAKPSVARIAAMAIERQVASKVVTALSKGLNRPPEFDALLDAGLLDVLRAERRFHMELLKHQPHQE